jgi:hypothetical protein
MMSDMLDMPMTKKMLKNEVKTARKEKHKPVSKMSKADLMNEFQMYKSPENIMAPAVKSSSMTAQLARKMKDVGKAPKMQMDSSSDEEEPVKPKKKFPFISKMVPDEKKVDEPRKSASKVAEPAKPGKKAPSPYNQFMAKHCKMGHSMAEVASLWKKHKGE